MTFRHHVLSKNTGMDENGEPQLRRKKRPFDPTVRNSEAENRDPQLHNKRGRLTTLRDSSEAENGEPQLQSK